MNVKNVTEIQKLTWPEVPEKLLIVYLDNAQKDFVRETRILTTSSELSDIATNFAWLLPSDFLEYLDIRAYDSDGNPVEIKDYNIKFEIAFGKLYAKSTSSVPITTITDSINKIYLDYVKSPGSITSIASSFTVDEDLQFGVLARANQLLFASIPRDVVVNNQIAKIIDLRTASYWEKEYKEKRIEAKKKANLKQNVKGEVQFYDQAGEWTLPKRSNDTSLSTTSSTALSGVALIYDKFALLTATEGVAAGTNEGQFGFSGTITVGVSGNTITITSTAADFVKGTLRIEHSNESIGWDYTSTSIITMTAETGWTKDTINLIVDKNA